MTWNWRPCSRWILMSSMAAQIHMAGTICTRVRRQLVTSSLSPRNRRRKAPMIRASGASQRRDSLSARMARSTASSSLDRMRLTRLTTVATRRCVAGRRAGSCPHRARRGPVPPPCGLRSPPSPDLSPRCVERSCLPARSGWAGSRLAIVTVSAPWRKTESESERVAPTAQTRPVTHGRGGRSLAPERCTRVHRGGDAPWLSSRPPQRTAPPPPRWSPT